MLLVSSWLLELCTGAEVIRQAVAMVMWGVEWGLEGEEVIIRKKERRNIITMELT